MSSLLYVSLMRFPTEKAHGLQIMQNCEAFAAAGWHVRLWVSGRANTPAMRAVADPFAFYGVARTFDVMRLPVLDLMPYTRGALERLAFYLVTLSYLLMLCLRLPFVRADRYYTRDEAVAWLLTWLKPRARVVYEAHQFAPRGGRGAWLQRQVCRRVGLVVAITAPLRDDLIAERGAPPERVLVAHDGFQARRFAELPTPAQARAQLGWAESAFIVGYVGRLQTLHHDKGVGALAQVVAPLAGVSLAIVGGEDAQLVSVRAAWGSMGGTDDRLYLTGQVAPALVPLALAACDVCVMPHPNNVYYTRYSSPMKLFEYMAAGKPIVAMAFPSWADVLRDEENALLLPPEDPAALRAALLRLRDDAPLRERLGQNARNAAFHLYTWEARARKILSVC